MKLGKNAPKNVSESKHNLSHYQPASIPHKNIKEKNLFNYSSAAVVTKG